MLFPAQAQINEIIPAARHQQIPLPHHRTDCSIHLKSIWILRKSLSVCLYDYHHQHRPSTCPTCFPSLDHYGCREEEQEVRGPRRLSSQPLSRSQAKVSVPHGASLHPVGTMKGSIKWCRRYEPILMYPFREFTFAMPRVPTDLKHSYTLFIAPFYGDAAISRATHAARKRSLSALRPADHVLLAGVGTGLDFYPSPTSTSVYWALISTAPCCAEPCPVSAC